MTPSAPSSRRGETAAPLGARNPRVVRLRQLLRDPGARAEHRLVVADSPHALAGALDRGARVVEVFVAAGATRSVMELATRAERSGADRFGIEPDVAARVSDARTSQGILACIAAPSAVLAPDASFVVVLAQIADPGNLGTVARSAEAAGADAIFVGRGSVDPYNPKSIRASAGAVFGIAVVEDDVVATLDNLRRAGFRRVGADAHDGTPIDDCALGGKVALVLGHETRGLGAGHEGLDLDARVSIPMQRPAESLNLAVAASVLCFEVARRRRAGDDRRAGDER